MRLVACYFGESPWNDWVRMAKVLRHSAASNCPDLEISVEQIRPAAMKSAIGSRSNEANSQKLEHWAAAVQLAGDGECLILMDADTMVVRDVTCAFLRQFDIAYTVRDTRPGTLPLNAGVLFVRVSDRVRRFFQLWQHENGRMLADADYHRPWCRQFGGINQAAFGKLLDEGIPGQLGVELLTLSCAEWNCEDSSWELFDPEVTRIVHLKSALRRMIFNLGPATPRLMPLARIWRGLERAAARSQGARA